MKSQHVYLSFDFDESGIDYILNFINWYDDASALVNIVNKFEAKYIEHVFQEEYLTQAIEKSNIKKALDEVDKFIKYVKQENEASLLDVSIIDSWHKILLQHDKDKCPGMHRTHVMMKEVRSGGGHYYPASYLVPNAYQCYVDIFCQMADAQVMLLADKKAYVTQLIKWTAWTLFSVLSLHPYLDSNGRCVRMLCHFILSQLIPFPVSICHVCETIVASRILCCQNFDEILQNGNLCLLANVIKQSIISDCNLFMQLALQK